MEQEFTQITLDQWMQWKEDIREKLRETAGNFVHIGYRLKQIRDSGMYDGAADVFEFANKEYGLSKSTVSRFIAINEKFSEGGNSLLLKEEYRAIGSSKLSEMLTLTDSECGMITERTTVKEIRELKNFSRQQEPGDMQETGQDSDPLKKCIVEYFRDKKELLNQVVPMIYRSDYKNAAEAVNPSGYSTFKKGLIFLFMYDYSQGVKYKTFGMQNITELSWEQFLLDIYDVFGAIYEGGSDDIHKAYFGEPKEAVREPEETREEKEIKDSVATSQQEQETPEASTGQQEASDEAADGVNMGKPEETTEDGESSREDIKEAAGAPEGAEETAAVQEDTEEAAGVQGSTEEAAGVQEGAEETADVPEEAGGIRDEDGTQSGAAKDDGAEQLDGQMNIEDFPEYMPDKEPEEQAAVDIAAAYLDALKDTLGKIYSFAEQGLYEAAEERIEAVKGTLQMIKEQRERYGEETA